MDDKPKIFVVDIQTDFSDANLVRKMHDTGPLPLFKLSDMDKIIMTDAARDTLSEFMF